VALTSVEAGMLSASRASERRLTDISNPIRVGRMGLLADVSEDGPVAIDAVMANLGDTVLRRSAGDGSPSDADLPLFVELLQAAERLVRMGATEDETAMTL
jgi:hypothetical protein